MDSWEKDKDLKSNKKVIIINYYYHKVNLNKLFHIFQLKYKWLPFGSLTTWRAAYVRTPSVHSLVSMSILPKSYNNR